MRNEGKSSKLEEHATRILEDDSYAAAVALRSIAAAWVRRERDAREANGGDLPSARVAAQDMFAAFADWTAAMSKPCGATNEMPSLLAEFVSAAAIFAKSYGQHVVLPTLEGGGNFEVPPRHDVERPALRIVSNESEKEGDT